MDLLFADMPMWMQRPAVDRVAAAALLILLLVYVPRLVLGLRAQLISSRPRLRVDGSVPPLRSQWAVIQQLIQNCGGDADTSRDTLERTPYEGKIVSINAGWGTGKTFIVRNFERLSNQSPTERGVVRPVNLVVSYFNAWSNQMEADPEYAIVRHLISDRRVMWPYGWLAVPAWQILFRSVFSSSGLLGGLRLKVSEVSVEGGLSPTPPSLNWTRTLENLAWCVWKRSPGGRKGASLVLIVDDVDRCAPLVAQKYVTMLRRGLSLPHLAVVLPYTADQLRYKVFNPLSVDLPDLGSSMEAAQAELIIGNGGRKDPFAPGAIGGRRDILSGLSEDFDALIRKRLDGALTGAGKGKDDKNGASWIEALNTWELLRRERLNQSYVEMVLGDMSLPGKSPTVAHRLMRQFESKYVSDAPILLPRLSYFDIVQIVMNLDSVKRVVFGDIEDGVATTLRHLIDKACTDPFRNPARAVSLPKPRFVSDVRLKAIRDDLSYQGQEARTNIQDTRFRDWMTPDNAPSIRTVIAATEHLMQNEAFAEAMARLNERPVKPEAIDESRYVVILAAFDRIVFNAYRYLVE